jgi:hypothetical protein
MNNKVTLEGIQAKIKGEVYLVLPDGKSTLCILTLENGYTIKGISACVDAANFDINIGRKIAFEDAIRQIWPLEGYLLAEKLYWDNAVPVATNPPPQWSTSNVDGIIVAKQKTARLRKIMDAPWGLKKDGTPKRKPGGPRK